MAPNGAKYSIVSDYLGTPTEMYTEAGVLAWKAQLDLYGVPSLEVGTRVDCPWRWPGQYEDEETGLYYNRFRYYDTGRGGYLSQDPIGLRGGLVPYGYVEDPLAQTDVFGLSGDCGDKKPPPINVQKQAGHVPGTSQYANRIASGKLTSTFFDAKQADTVTVEAWQMGTALDERMRRFEFGKPIGIGPGGGGYQTQVRVSLDSGGKIHGTPWGPVFQGPLLR